MARGKSPSAAPPKCGSTDPDHRVKTCLTCLRTYCREGAARRRARDPEGCRLRDRQQRASETPEARSRRLVRQKVTNARRPPESIERKRLGERERRHTLEGRAQANAYHRRRRRECVADLLAAQGGLCGLCGELIADGERVNIDHIVPRSRGGSGERGNLRAVHRACNEAKRALLDPVIITAHTGATYRCLDCGSCHVQRIVA